MDTLKNFFAAQVASYAGWWQWIAQIYVPVLSGFLN